MVSNNAFRTMGYIYTGLCIVGSLLLIINSSNTLQASGYENSGYSDSSKILITNVSVTSVIFLIFTIISLVFNVCLMLGIVMRNITLVKCHLYYLTTIYILLAVGLFIGCIVVGIVISQGAGYHRVEETSAIVIAVTIVFIFYTIVATLFYTLSVWILNGVIGYIKYENIQLMPGGLDHII